MHNRLPCLVSHASGPLSGIVRVPGDKSISHRAFILGGLACGESEIHGVLEGDDVLHTAQAMADFGAKVERVGPQFWRIEGCGEQGLRAPDNIVDCGNSGTGVRLIMGAMAGYPIAAQFTGDESLQARPMARVLEPLALMGAHYEARDGRFLPVLLQGATHPNGVDYAPPHASAQVKSALLLCGLRAQGITRITETVPTRDHTERMIRAFGGEIDSQDRAEGRVITLAGGQKLHGQKIEVPSDPSSAAFLVAAAILTEGSQLTLTGVLKSPERFGLYDSLIEMGADLTLGNARQKGGETIVDIHVRASPLRGIDLPVSRVASMIDEIPIFALLAAFATGETRISGAGELRVKESDRLALMSKGLRAMGCKLEDYPDGLWICGSRSSLAAPVATIETHGDHRIAMSFLVAGLALKGGVCVDRADMIATSFPGFAELMNQLGADIRPA